MIITFSMIALVYAMYRITYRNDDLLEARKAYESFKDYVDEGDGYIALWVRDANHTKSVWIRVEGDNMHKLRNKFIKEFVDMYVSDLKKTRSHGRDVGLIEIKNKLDENF